MIVWTASLEDWCRDEKLFAQLAVGDYVHLPCIRRENVPGACKVNVEADYFVVTSAYTARCLAGSLLESMQSGQVICFGSETSLALQELRLNVQTIQCSSAGELCQKIISDSRYLKTDSFCVVGAEHPAFPMADKLRVQGYQVKELAVYRTLGGRWDGQGKEVSPTEVEAIDSTKTVYCFASPSAVRGFIANIKEPLQGIAVAIGPTTAAVVSSTGLFTKVRVGKSPGRKQLLEEALAI